MSDSGRQPDAPVITRWIGRLRGAGSPFRTPEPFVLAGIDWQGPEQALIELRARGVTGGWTPWVRASVLGHDSDRGETIAHALVGEPIWTGRADAVQLRSNVVVEGLNLHLVRAAAVLGPGQPGVGTAATDPAQTGGPSTATAAQSLPLAIPRLPAGPGQPPIIARQAWAGGLLPRVPPAYGDVRMAFVHHSVTANGYSPAEVPAVLRSIYYFHTYTRGWNDFGYNFAVDRYGRIWEGRAGGVDRPVIGAQAGGYNPESFGAVLLGDFVATLPTSAALAALGRLVAWKLALHGVPVKGRVTVEVDPSDAFYTRFRPGQHVSLPRIAAHRDGCTTSCPGEDMYLNGMPPLRGFVAEIVGRQLNLSLEVGPGPAYAIAPYAISPGTKVRRASYLDIATVILTAGRELPFHGRLRSLSGVPVRAAKVELQSLTSNRREVSESKLSGAVTRADGLWTAVLKPHANLLVRALHADAPAAVSALIAVGVKPEVTLALTRTDGGLAVSGTVSPAKPRIVLKIQSASGARRVVEHRTVEPKHGAFETMIRLSGGRYWVTAQTVADATNLAGSSRRVAVHI